MSYGSYYWSFFYSTAQQSTPWDRDKADTAMSHSCNAINRCNFAYECTDMMLGLQESHQKMLRYGNKLLGETFHRRELWRVVIPERVCPGLGLWMSQISAACSYHFISAPRTWCTSRHSLEHNPDYETQWSAQPMLKLRNQSSLLSAPILWDPHWNYLSWREKYAFYEEAKHGGLYGGHKYAILICSFELLM